MEIRAEDGRKKKEEAGSGTKVGKGENTGNNNEGL